MDVVYAHQRRLGNLEGLAAKDDESMRGLLLDNVEAMRMRYNQYSSGIQAALDDNDFARVTGVLNDYRRYVKDTEKEFLSSKSKYYSSVLEEFPVLLLKARVETLIGTLGLDSDNFVLGAAECRIGSVVGPDCVQSPEKKCIDFCLAYRADNAGMWQTFPLVGFEVKKYMDKTMFGTVLETHQALIGQRPKTVYGFIVEDEARDKDVVMNSKLYGSEFVLSGQMRNRDSLCDFPEAKIVDLDTSLMRIFSQNLEFFAEARAMRNSYGPGRRRTIS